jgi:hypothetical protein
MDRFRRLVNEILGEETPGKEDDNEDSKIKWIIDEFDYRNNNDDLVQGIDLLVSRPQYRRSSNIKSLKKRKSKALQTQSSNSDSTSSLEESEFSSSYYSQEEDQFEQFHKSKDKARKKLRSYQCLCLVFLNIIFWAEQFYR